MKYEEKRNHPRIMLLKQLRLLDADASAGTEIHEGFVVDISAKGMLTHNSFVGGRGDVRRFRIVLPFQPLAHSDGPAWAEVTARCRWSEIDIVTNDPFNGWEFVRVPYNWTDIVNRIRDVGME